MHGTYSESSQQRQTGAVEVDGAVHEVPTAEDHAQIVEKEVELSVVVVKPAWQFHSCKMVTAKLSNLYTLMH